MGVVDRVVVREIENGGGIVIFLVAMAIDAFFLVAITIFVDADYAMFMRKRVIIEFASSAEIRDLHYGAAGRLNEFREQVVVSKFFRYLPVQCQLFLEKRSI